MNEISCLLIRHGRTKGNIEKRYIGCKTDEALCKEGIEQLKQCKGALLKDVKLSEKVYVSPLIRCRETANILFPDSQYEVVDDFKEIDFGTFENKNYVELQKDENYQRWIDSNGTMPFPDGELREHFIDRNVNAFTRILVEETDSNQNATIPFVFHGGSIMAVLSVLTGKDYYDFQISCGEAYLVKIVVKEDKINVISYDRISCGDNT